MDSSAGSTARPTSARSLTRPFRAAAAAMLAVPDYGGAMSGKRNQSEPLEWVGAALVTMAAPAVATLADYLFRQRRD